MSNQRMKRLNDAWADLPERKIDEAQTIIDAIKFAEGNNANAVKFKGALMSTSVDKLQSAGYKVNRYNGFDLIQWDKSRSFTMQKDLCVVGDAVSM